MKTDHPVPLAVMTEGRKRKDQTSALVERDGALCVTFVNTTADQRQPVSDYAGLVAWGRRHGALTEGEVHRLEALAAERPEDAASAFGVAEVLRGLLARILEALADGEEPPDEAIESLNGFFVHTVPPPRIVRGEDGFGLDWAAGREDDLGRPLWRIVESATDVVTSKVRGRVARCAGEGCGLFFLVRNRGTPRKWCDMKSCGSRAKASRRYHGHVKQYRQEIRQESKEAVLKRAEERYARLYGKPSGRI